MGDPHHQIDQPAYHGIHPFGADGRGRSRKHRDHRTDRRGGQAHRNADGHTFKRAKKQISPQRIRPERMGRTGRKLCV